MRIISLLPAATEILYLLGSGKNIVGISEECNFPKDTKNKKVVSFCLINRDLTSKEIDAKVSKSLSEGVLINRINDDLFVSLKPDLVITQELCKVCSITPNNIQKTLKQCNKMPNVLSLHPHSIKEILNDILQVGKIIGKGKQAKLKVKSLKLKVKKIQDKTKNLKKKKVYCMEWMDPPYNGGHWIPEQVSIAGGIDDMSTKGGDSVRLIWEKIIEYDPEVLVLMPCGFSIERTKKELPRFLKKAEWQRLRAVKKGEVYLVNGPAFFNASGPRVIKGIEILAAILHPKLFQNNFKRNDLQKLDTRI